MHISREELLHYATIARIELSEANAELFVDQFNETLDYADRIFAIDLEGVMPTVSPTNAANTLRKDEVLPGLSTQDALINAPESEDNAFLVPQIIGQGGDAS